jgi:hypothetical protein
MYDIWDTDTVPTIKKRQNSREKIYRQKLSVAAVFLPLPLKKVSVFVSKLENTDVFSHRTKHRDEHQSVLPLYDLSPPPPPAIECRRACTCYPE